MSSPSRTLSKDHGSVPPSPELTVRRPRDSDDDKSSRRSSEKDRKKRDSKSRNRSRSRSPKESSRSDRSSTRRSSKYHRDDSESPARERRSSKKDSDSSRIRNRSTSTSRSRSPRRSRRSDNDRSRGSRYHDSSSSRRRYRSRSHSDSRTSSSARSRSRRHRSRSRPSEDRESRSYLRRDRSRSESPDRNHKRRRFDESSINARKSDEKKEKEKYSKNDKDGKGDKSDKNDKSDEIEDVCATTTTTSQKPAAKTTGRGKVYDFLIGSEGSTDSFSSSRKISVRKASSRERDRDRGRERDRDRDRDRDRYRSRSREYSSRSFNSNSSSDRRRDDRRSRERSYDGHRKYQSSRSSRRSRSRSLSSSRSRSHSRSPTRRSETPYFPLRDRSRSPSRSVESSSFDGTEISDKKTSECPFLIVSGTPSSPNAWVLLIFGGNSYVPGIIAAAHSLRLSKTTADIVCLVTDDVTESALEDIARVCDVVILVPYVIAPAIPMKTDNQKSMYGAWNDKSFTKWTSLALTMYQKVCFFDADKVALSNMDDVFEMTAPAGTFGSSWGKCVDTEATDPGGYRRRRLGIKKDSRGEMISPYKSGGAHMDWVSSQVGYDVSLGFTPRNQGMNNPYWGLKHGDAVHPDLIYYGLNKKSFVAVGTMILLEPNLRHYEEFKDMIVNDPICTSSHQGFGFPDCYSGKDEQSIAYFYMRKGVQWHYIDARYNSIPWLSKWLMYTSEVNIPKLYHYFNIKPWVYDRETYPDLEIWWAVVRDMVRKFQGKPPKLTLPSNSEKLEVEGQQQTVITEIKEDTKVEVLETDSTISTQTMQVVQTDNNVGIVEVEQREINDSNVFKVTSKENEDGIEIEMEMESKTGAVESSNTLIATAADMELLSLPLARYFDPISLVKPLKKICSWCSIMKKPASVYTSHYTLDSSGTLSCPDMLNRTERLLCDFGDKLQ